MTIGYHDGSNVVILDYFLSAKSACNTAAKSGVCPDTVFGGFNSLGFTAGSFIGTRLSIEYFK